MTDAHANRLASMTPMERIEYDEAQRRHVVELVDIALRTRGKSYFNVYDFCDAIRERFDMPWFNELGLCTRILRRCDVVHTLDDDWKWELKPAPAKLGIFGRRRAQ